MSVKLTRIEKIILLKREIENEEKTLRNYLDNNYWIQKQQSEEEEARDNFFLEAEEGYYKLDVLYKSYKKEIEFMEKRFTEENIRKDIIRLEEHIKILKIKLKKYNITIIDKIKMKFYTGRLTSPSFIGMLVGEKLANEISKGMKKQEEFIKECDKEVQMNKETLIQYSDLKKEIQNLEKRIDRIEKQSAMISDVVQKRMEGKSSYLRN